ncbi:MAG: helix-turn-helix domain-containing protein, partial [Mycobacteriaceae bacterium]
MTNDEPRWRRMGPDQRREEILASAVTLFAQRPYGEVSTAEIASAAGVARGLLNHYFGTKRELYLEVVRTVSTIPAVTVAELPTGTLEERIDAAVSGFLDSVQHAGSVWITAGGTGGIGRDRELEKILISAEDQSVDRVLHAVGLSDATGSGTALRALIRSYGQMARAGGGEWLLRMALSREQLHMLLTTTLLAIVRDV